MENVKQVVIETAKQGLQNLSKNISTDITTKLEASAAPSIKSSQYLSDIVHKQKNLMNLTNRKSEMQTCICRQEENKMSPI